MYDFVPCMRTQHDTEAGEGKSFGGYLDQFPLSFSITGQNIMGLNIL